MPQNVTEAVEAMRLLGITADDPRAPAALDRAMAYPTPAELLDFEATHPKHTGLKENAIRDELGITPARYYQLLNRAASSTEGIAHNPTTARIVRQRHLAAH